jgi:hypothetical protein
LPALLIKKQRRNKKMSCTLATGIALDTCNGNGGYKRLKVTAKSNVLTWADSSSVITATVDDTALIFEIAVPQDMIGAYSTQQDTRENNVAPVYDHIVSVMTQKNSAANRTFLKLLGANEVVAFALDNNGDWLAFGDITRGLRTVVKGKDHKKPGDAFGQEVELKATGLLNPEGKVASGTLLTALDT